jgi:flagellar hook-associated protein 3 FlgL
MNVRVTGQTQVNNAIANLRRQASDAARFQEQLSSGVKVAAASDAPATFGTITAARAASKRTATYQETLNDSTSDLDAGVSVLQDVSTTLTRATQLAVTGASGTLDGPGFEAVASEVDALFDRLLAAANQQQDGRYLFGGTETQTKPFRVDTLTADGKPATVAYDGAAERARALVSKSQTVDTRYVGSDVFQAVGGDVFGAIIGLRDDLRNASLNDSAKTEAVSLRLADIQNARNTITKAMGEQSGSLAGMEAITNRLADLKLNADVRATDLESTDYAEAVLRLKEGQSAFEATLGVSAKLLQPSLLDFIR